MTEAKRLVPFFALLSACAHTAPGRPAPVAPSAAEPAEEWCIAAAHDSREADRGVSGALAILNGRFLEAHARARKESCQQLESQRLVIRYSSGVLEARFRGKALPEGQVDVLPREYHPVKDVSHAVFLVALILAERPGDVRTAHARDALGATEAVMSELSDPASKAWQLIPADQQERQRRILGATQRALTALVAGKLDDAAARAYFSSVQVDLRENIRAVARALVRGLHQAVQRVREQVDPRDWDSVVVVVGVAHQARAREIGIQYFERLLSEPVGEGARNERRLVVAEGMIRGPEQYGLLAAHLVDQAGASAIFNDALRLQSDVTADDGGMLDSLLPKPK
jgi:hypothetical protein